MSRLILDADFSSVEARIVCWLAGQEDALARFRAYDQAETEEEKNRMDPYRIQAASIYNIPVDQVNKFPQRFVGKHAILLCGFQGGPPKFRDTCFKIGGGYVLPEGLEDIAVGQFRKDHDAVVKLWDATQTAAYNAIVFKGQIQTVTPKYRRGDNTNIPLPKFQKIDFLVKDIEGMPFLLCRLPSGRKLSYPHPKLVPSRRKGWEGQKVVSFFGNIMGTKWGDVDTYGGKLVENCLGGETQVLSKQRGWVQLKSVTMNDALWDGEEFVEHQGVVLNGRQQVLDCHGIWATPEHQFLTEGRWVSAQTACTLPINSVSSVNETPFLPPPWETFEPFRTDVRQFDCGKESTHGREKDSVDLHLQMWTRSKKSRVGVTEKTKCCERVWALVPNHNKSYRGFQFYSRDESPSSLCSLEEYVGPVQQPQTSSVEKLRGERDHCLRGMAGLVRELLEGHGPNLQARAGHRPGEQRRRLLKVQLQMDNPPNKYPEPEKNHKTGRRTPRFLGRSVIPWYQKDDALLSPERWPKLERRYQYPSGHTEQVYDILDCGPRRRFAVKSRSGHILIAHNCTQAVAADLMANGAHKCEEAGFEIMTLIHDQALAYHQPHQTVERFVELLTDLPSWATGLPIAAEGALVPFYKKD